MILNRSHIRLDEKTFVFLKESLRNLSELSCLEEGDLKL